MKLSIKRITIISLTAAVYVALTIGLTFISFGSIQCRISEIMNLLIFINPIFAPGVVLGCFISNLFSPNGPIDWILGTLATTISACFISKSKNLFIASLMPTIFCIFIGLEFLILSGPPYSMLKLIVFSLQVMTGEFISVTIIGYPMFKYIMKNDKFINILKSI